MLFLKQICNFDLISHFKEHSKVHEIGLIYLMYIPFGPIILKNVHQMLLSEL
jgi:hypothetical protein